MRSRDEESERKTETLEGDKDEVCGVSDSTTLSGVDVK